jgi:regulator of sigma E protease
MLNLTTWIVSLLHSIFAFVIILVPLVVFHEFGHYVFARIFGVRADVFSVGFGPRIWGFKRGETEWRLSAIPLGGYVQLLGQDREAEVSETDRTRALHLQAPWKRFLIFLGGPLFNFILAVFIFMLILIIGEPQMASVVGRVVHFSVAEKAGFRSGDRILSIEGKSVTRFEEVLLALNESPGKDLDFEVRHLNSNQPVHLNVKTSSQTGLSMYGETVFVGEIEGLQASPRSNQAGVSNHDSPAGRAGIVTGNKIVQLNNNTVSTFEELESLYEEITPLSSFSVSFQGQDSGPSHTVRWVKPKHSLGLGKDFGLYSSELFVEKTVAQSPAEKAGVLAGDRLIAVGNREVLSFFDLKDAVQESGEKEGNVMLSWEHLGRISSKLIQPTATSGRDPLLKQVTRYTVGVMPMLVLAEPVTIIERVWNPIRLVTLATQKMVTFSWRNFVSLRKMVTGEVSMGTLGGPIMIGKIAGESLSRGLAVFLTNMAIFSIGLGVLNVLPVPVLDGGHLMLLGVEIVRGKPLTLRQMEVIQSLGLILILTLMGIAFRNDLARLIYS